MPYLFKYKLLNTVDPRILMEAAILIWFWRINILTLSSERRHLSMILMNKTIDVVVWKLSLADVSKDFQIEVYVLGNVKLNHSVY